MILFVGDVARGMQRARGVSGGRFPRLLRPHLQMGRADRRSGAHPRIYRPRLCHGDQSGRPGPVVLALPEDMLVDEVPARGSPRSPFVHRPAQAALPRCDGRDVRSDRRCRQPGGDHRRRRLERQGARIFPAICRKHRPAGGHRLPPAGRDCARFPVYAGNLGYGPNPKLVERVKAPTCHRWWVRGWARRRPMATPWSRPITPASS
jgi:acetolactate synthase I/II/III large subunit